MTVKQTLVFLLFIGLIFTFYSCGENYSKEEISYIRSIESERAEKNDWMQDDPSSPFKFKEPVEFSELNYYDVDLDYIFKSKLYEYENKDTVTIYGTKGEERKSVRYGYLNLNYQNEVYKVNLYESKLKGDTYYSIWFTDKTTGKETYGVGRYLNFKVSPDKDYIYTIDFNMAYNPYCAYNKEFSCAVPTKEDYIGFAIKAGEKKFHD